MTFRSILLISGLLLVSGTASALTFTIADIRVSAGTTDGATTATVPAGATVTVDVLILNDTSEAMAALGATAFGFNTTVLGFDTGLASKSVHNNSVFFGLVPVNGIGNTQGTPGAPVGGTELPNPQIIAAESILPDGAVRFFNGVTVSPVVGQAEFDAGVIPALITVTLDGDVHAQLTFTALSDGSTDLLIGVDGVNGAWIDGTGANRSADVVNATVAITVPEAGSIASGLAAVGSVFTVVGIRRRRI